MVAPGRFLSRSNLTPSITLYARARASSRFGSRPSRLFPRHRCSQFRFCRYYYFWRHTRIRRSCGCGTLQLNVTTRTCREKTISFMLCRYIIQSFQKRDTGQVLYFIILSCYYYYYYVILSTTLIRPSSSLRATVLSAPSPQTFRVRVFCGRDCGVIF